MNLSPFYSDINNIELSKVDYYTEEGNIYPIINKERYYTPGMNNPIQTKAYPNPLKSKNCQVRDTKIIEDLIATYYPPGTFYYISEAHTSITDSRQENKDGSKSKVYSSFDHFILCTANRHCIILESQDPSHYRAKACTRFEGVRRGKLTPHQMLQKIKYNDRRKKEWCSEFKYLLCTLPHALSNNKKAQIIKQGLDYIIKLK